MTPGADRLTRILVGVIAAALAWLAIRPQLPPVPAEGARETVNVNIERIGGRTLWDGTISVRCTR